MTWLGESEDAGMTRQQMILLTGMPVGVIDRRRECAAIRLTIPFLGRTC